MPDKTLDSARWLEPLAARFSAGVVLVDADGTVAFADSTARQHVHADTDEAFQLAIAEMLRALPGPGSIELDATSERVALVVERVVADAGACLLLISDATRVEAADLDMLLANRMRGIENLYRAMAHDLKSPLHAVVLNIDLLRQLVEATSLDDDERSKIATYLDVIQGEISRLGRTIQTLLSQASPGHNKSRRVDLRRIQREVAALLEPVARRKEINVRTSQPKRPVSVIGNRDRIKQAVLNLAVNAIEAMDRRGNLELDLDVRDGMVFFEVRDDGPGIPESIRTRVFEARFTTKETGTGIGLGLARSVSRAHGGELELQARAPRGTIARIRLPLSAPRPRA